MNYREEVRDLFSVPEEYFLAHCISADFAMGKGIVLEFNKRFDMKRQLRQKYPGYLAGYRQNPAGGDCILEGRVLNLVTKERYFHKPTLSTMEAALQKNAGALPGRGDCPNRHACHRCGAGPAAVGGGSRQDTTGVWR